MCSEWAFATYLIQHMLTYGDTPPLRVREKKNTLHIFGHLACLDKNLLQQYWISTKSHEWLDECLDPRLLFKSQNIESCGWRPALQQATYEEILQEPVNPQRGLFTCTLTVDCEKEERPHFQRVKIK